DPLSRQARRPRRRSPLQRQPQGPAGSASHRSGSTSTPPAPTCTPARHRREPPRFSGAFLLLGSFPSTIVAPAVPLMVIPGASVKEPLEPRLPFSVPSAAVATPRRSSSSLSNYRDRDGLCVRTTDSKPRVPPTSSSRLPDPSDPAAMNSKDIHEGLNFSAAEDESSFGIFSIKFSKDGRELVGNSNESICIYDLGANKVTERIHAHVESHSVM
uniref:Uncharacterized protein n=2 Tax=Aegilops tauschii subsp. strangulata TaxID=200361 RepID=A0A453MBH0_AEGTS